MNHQIETEFVEWVWQLLSGTANVLRDMHRATSLPGGEDGAQVQIDQTTRIRVRQSAVLHQLVREVNAGSRLEVGLAYGFDTAWLLDALSRRAGSTHVAIDPFQRLTWSGVGIQTTRRLGLPVAFECIEE